MTPKEQAEKSFRAYIDYTFGAYNCKQCALIAVDKILDVCLPCYPSQKEFNEFINYWIEVKQEIEKL